VCAFAVVCSIGFADQISLVNGDRVTGKVIKKEADSVTVKSDLIGEVTLKWKDVAAISTEAPVTVVTTPGTVQGTLSTAEGKVIVKTPGGEQTVPLSDVSVLRNPDEQRRYERYQNPLWTDLWAGYLDLSLASASGNSRTLTFATAMNATRATNHDKTSAYFNQIYSRGLVNNVLSETAKAMRGGWSYNHDLSPRIFLNVFNDYEHDKFQSLNLRTVAGGGLGFHLIKGEQLNVDVLGGGSWNREDYFTPIAPATDTTEAQFVRNSAEVYWGDELLWKLHGKSSLKQSFRMFNNLSDTGSYRVNFDLGIDSQIWKSLSWQITGSDRYITNPAPGRKTNDLLISAGIRFTFSRLP
jgi:putative salt-induced outer membrane protein YdiY